MASHPRRQKSVVSVPYITSQITGTEISIEDSNRNFRPLQQMELAVNNDCIFQSCVL